VVAALMQISFIIDWVLAGERSKRSIKLLGRDTRQFPQISEYPGFYTGEGYRDDGTFTDSDGDPLMEPIAILRYLLVNYGGFDETEFIDGSDVGSYMLARAWLAELWLRHSDHIGMDSSDWGYPGYPFYLICNFDSRITLEDALARILMHCPGISYYVAVSGTQRKAYVTTNYISVNPSWPIVRSEPIRYTSDILDDSFSLTVSGLDSLATSIVVEYGFDVMNRNYAFSAKATSTGSDDGLGNSWAAIELETGTTATDMLAAAKSWVGIERALHFQLPFIWDPSGAVAVGNYVAAMRTKPSVTVTFETPLHVDDIMPGAYIKFAQDDMPHDFPVYNHLADDPWETYLWFVQSKTFRFSGGGGRWRYTATLAPHTLGTGSPIMGGEVLRGLADMT
jgi:hypothetical protein